MLDILKIIGALEQIVFSCNSHFFYNFLNWSISATWLFHQSQAPCFYSGKRLKRNHLLIISKTWIFLQNFMDCAFPRQAFNPIPPMLDGGSQETMYLLHISLLGTISFFSWVSWPPSVESDGDFWHHPTFSCRVFQRVCVIERFF